MSVIKPALQQPNLITHLLGANNYCWIYYQNGEKKLLAKPISYLQEELPGFIRTHKSVLINPIHVKSLTPPPRQKMAGEIQLKGGLVFPVSRRRWPEVADALNGGFSPDGVNLNAEFPLVARPPRTTHTQSVSKRSILLITGDLPSEPLLAQMMVQNWPAYRLQTLSRSTLLPDQLSQIPEDELPTLILLDARTATVERLHTLQRLKLDAYLCRLPVILFVSPADTLVTDGYKRQANSVISIQDSHLSFVQTMERVCRFWLQMAALPILQKPALASH